MSKIGHLHSAIATIRRSIFEAVGFTPEFVNAYFAGTVSRVGGMGVEDVEREQTSATNAALDHPLRDPAPDQLPTLGSDQVAARLGGEEHLIDPQTVYPAADRLP